MPVLDASFLIALEHGHRKASELSRRLAESRRPLWIPTVAWMEYLTGLRAKQHAEAISMLESMGTPAPFDQAMAQLGAVLQDGFLRSGKRMGWNDIQIAATALHLKEPVVTMDRDFSGIAGLDVLRP